jgi:hypothetical protein
MKVAYAKLGELGKNEFSLNDPIELKNTREILVGYVFPLNPRGYMVIAASYNLPPVIAYSFTDSCQDDDDTNILFELLIADLTLRLENIPELPESMIEMRHQTWESLLNKKPMIHQLGAGWKPTGIKTVPTTTSALWIKHREEIEVSQDAPRSQWR